MMHGISTLAERWFEGAVFLSLDLTRQFFVDLWVPLDDAAKFQSELRRLLEACLDEESYYSEQEALGYRVMEWVHNTYGSEHFEAFSFWIRSILVVEGPDRPGETLWSSLSFEMARQFENNSSAPKWMAQLMTAIVSLERSKRRQFDVKLEAAEDQELGPWDRHVLAIKDSSMDAVLTNTSLIGTYNIFLAAWEKHASNVGYAELHQLWQLGKEMAVDLGMDPSDLVFPGVWRFESLQLITKFAKTGPALV